MTQRNPFLTILIIIGMMFLLSTVLVINAQDDIPTWDEETRFTVLVMGMDRRPGADNSVNSRTDVMILLSIDPINEQIGMLHIPRDLHFTPTDRDALVRVNTLVIEGETVQEGYGPYYALDTLQFNLGMYIDRYIIIDFDAFIDIVDVLGGIEITTSYPIYDLTYPDMNYGYDPFRLEAGTHLLDGRDALKFARTRHGDNDFLRGERQMQVIQAIHKKVTQDNMLSTLIRQAPSLYASLSENIFTDMTLEEMLQLARFAMQIPAENITTGSIDDEYNMTYALPTGRNVYIPDREKLIELLTNVFGEGYNS